MAAENETERSPCARRRVANESAFAGVNEREGEWERRKRRKKHLGDNARLSCCSVRILSTHPHEC